MFFEFIGYAALLLIGGLVLVFLLNKVAGINLFHAGRAQVGKLGRAAIDADPTAVLMQGIDDAAVHLRQAQEHLAEQKALVTSTTRKVDELEKDQTRLVDRIQRAVDAGDPNGTAEGYAKELVTVEEELEHQQTLLVQYKASYDAFRDQVEQAEEDLSAKRDRAKSLGHQLKQSEQERKLAEWQRVNAPKLSSVETDEVEAKIQAQIDKNRAVGEVGRDLSRMTLAQRSDDALERDARAQDVLARFKKPAPASEG